MASPVDANSQRPQTGRKVLRYGKSPSQFLHLHYPQEKASKYPLVVFVHGGFWKSQYGISPPTAPGDALAPDLQSHGIAVAELEYRRNADKEWGWPHTNKDVLTGFEVAASDPLVDRSRIFLIGHSAGGTLVLWLAAYLARTKARCQPLRTFALAPVADLREAVRLQLSSEGDAVVRYMHASPESAPERYKEACPTGAVSHLADLNIALVSGGKDKAIPSTIVERLYEAVQETVRTAAVTPKGKMHFHTFKDADHYDLVNPDTQVWSFVRKEILSEMEAERSVDKQ